MPPALGSSSCTIYPTEWCGGTQWYAAAGPQPNVQLEGWHSPCRSTKRHARAIITAGTGWLTAGFVAARAYGVPIMCSCFSLHFSVWRETGHLCRTSLLTGRFLENWRWALYWHIHLSYTVKAMASSKDGSAIIPVLPGTWNESKK